MRHQARWQPLRRRRAALQPIAVGPMCAALLWVTGAALRCRGVHARAAAAAGSWGVHARGMLTNLQLETNAARVRACAAACACEGASGAGGGHAGGAGDRACVHVQCARCRDSPSVEGGVRPGVCGECAGGWTVCVSVARAGRQAFTLACIHTCIGVRRYPSVCRACRVC